MRHDALTEEGRQLGAARQQAAEQVQAIRNRVAAEASEARQALQEETQVLAAQVAGQVLGRKI